MLRRAAAVLDDAIEHPDRVVGIDPPLDLDRERLAGVLVDDMQALEDAAVAGHVELEVERPHVVRPLGSQTGAGRRREAEPEPLAPLARHPQPFLAPQALDLLAVGLQALLAQAGPRLAVAP